jgi:glycosyltransferase involved in cell wall biosynthesis
MKEATGKWLLFADCDDFYEKGFIVELDKYCKSDYDIVFFDAHIQYDIDKKTSRKSRLTQLIDNYLTHPESDYHKKMLKHGTNNTWQRMYSRKYVERIGALYDEIPACNDGWFVHYLSAHTDHIAAIPQKLYYYVKTSGSIVNGKRSKQVELQIQDAHCRIHNLLADTGAYDAIRPFFKGTRKLFKNFGLTFAIYCLIRKLRHDVSPLKVLFHKYIKTINETA